MVAKVLEHPTLVLNRNWQPVNVATVARALVLLWNESARVVDPADYQLYTWADWSQLRPRRGERFIQAVRLRLRVPEVIVLTDYDRLPTAAVTLQPAQHLQARPLHLPVLRLPAGQRGTDDRPRRAAVAGRHVDLGELRAGLHGCNKRKADRTPEQAGMKLRKVPVRPTWKPLYARDSVRIESWSKFVSEAYWNVALEK